MVDLSDRNVFEAKDFYLQNVWGLQNFFGQKSLVLHTLSNVLRCNAIAAGLWVSIKKGIYIFEKQGFLLISGHEFKKVLEPPAESQRNPRIKDSPRHYYYLTAEFALIPYM